MNAQALIAWNLRKLRVAKGLSQEALAIDAGIDRTYVSRLERNLENPTVAVLERIALAMNSRLTDFFETPEQGELRSSPLPSGRHPKKERNPREKS
jgi:transcriptional regulator with XRE-family HTH domain